MHVDILATFLAVVSCCVVCRVSSSSFHNHNHHYHRNNNNHHQLRSDPLRGEGRREIRFIDTESKYGDGDEELELRPRRLDRSQRKRRNFRNKHPKRNNNNNNNDNNNDNVADDKFIAADDIYSNSADDTTSERNSWQTKKWYRNPEELVLVQDVDREDDSGIRQQQQEQEEQVQDAATEDYTDQTAAAAAAAAVAAEAEESSNYVDAAADSRLRKQPQSRRRLPDTLTQPLLLSVESGDQGEEGDVTQETMFMSPSLERATNGESLLSATGAGAGGGSESSLGVMEWTARPLQARKAAMEQQLLENDGAAVECCPTVVEMVEPHGGLNMDGMFVELFRDDAVAQRFYERSCRADVLGEPCRFLDRRLERHSRCVQKYSYTYALVKGTERETHHHHHTRHHRRNGTASAASHHNWRLDYIRTHSGCACEVEPPPSLLRRKKSRKSHKHHRPTTTL